MHKPHMSSRQVACETNTTPTSVNSNAPDADYHFSYAHKVNWLEYKIYDFVDDSLYIGRVLLKRKIERSNSMLRKRFLNFFFNFFLANFTVFDRHLRNKIQLFSQRLVK